VDAAREVAKFSQRVLGSRAGLGDQLSDALGVFGELLLGHPQAHPERDQRGLRAVVEVALDPAELRVLKVDGSRATGLQRLDPLGHLGVARGRQERGGSKSPSRIAIASIG
jgi:hypothetical protein